MLKGTVLWSVVTAGAIAAGLAVAPLASASAQQAASRPAAAAVQSKPVFRARDLVTPAERQAYRQSMRAARNDVARQRQLREQWTTTLRNRAAQKGGVLWQPPAKPAQAQGSAQREPNRPAAALPPRAP